MSYVEYPLTYTSVFANFRESDQREMETNAMSLAQDEHGPLPYELEVFVTPGRMDPDDFFTVVKPSNFMVRVIVFANEGQRATYLAKRDLRYSNNSNVPSKPNDDESHQDQAQ